MWDRLFVHCVLEFAEVVAFIGTDDQRADFMEKLDSLKRLIILMLTFCNIFNFYNSITANSNTLFHLNKVAHP